MGTATTPGSDRAQTWPIQPAWPWDWENRPAKDQCRHRWEIVTVARLFNPHERVARCAICHTPRCGYAEDDEPCQLRRHHDGGHLPVRRPAPV